VVSVVVRPVAQADLDDAFAWYQGQAPGLGHEFLRAVAAVFEQIARHPEMFPDVYRGRRRALVRRFPYAVYYRASIDRAVVIACLHLRRGPHVWRSRV
jgi:plasmid stabilization system protein ParE